jgi:hypothetical protein
MSFHIAPESEGGGTELKSEKLVPHVEFKLVIEPYLVCSQFLNFAFATGE